MSQKLRELIKSVRACKTAQEEREVIAKECALIRTSFKEGENSYRARNVAKLLYIHMLGYPTHFGQMECLKLIASPKFHEKRVGYLGLTQLLDENTEILMLVTNSIKNDINSGNQFVSGTALCALGNIGNHEMCLALSREVQLQLSHENPFIRKKAALCAMRIIKRVEDIEDKFTARLTALLEDKNHGVALAACSLLVHLLETNKEYISEFQHAPQLLIKTLKSILMSGYANAGEYDFSGIVDPFLQVKILRLIRLFASQLHADDLNDVLAQIATNTDGSKNAGNAVLYECVQTIMAINAESGLRVLGINILGKFLASKDNNVKYVALQTLSQVAEMDPKSVLRHRETLFACMADADLAIRKRALDVVFMLVNSDNIKTFTRELIVFLEHADKDFKADLASRICMGIDKYAPDKRWHIDSTVKVLSLGSVGDEVMFSVCHLVAGAPELHAYAAHKMFYLLMNDDVSEPLMIVGTWILGEYGHLLSGRTEIVFDLIDSVINKSLALAADQAAKNQNVPKSVVCEYAVTAVTKLSIKTKSNRNRVEATLKRFEGSISVDLQQRVCEFLAILGDSWDEQTRAGLLDVMPPSDKSIAASIARPVGDVSLGDAVPLNADELVANLKSSKKFSQTMKPRVKQGVNAPVGTLGLDDLLGDATVVPATAAPKVSNDLLNDLFG